MCQHVPWSVLSTRCRECNRRHGTCSNRTRTWLACESWPKTLSRHLPLPLVASYLAYDPTLSTFCFAPHSPCPQLTEQIKHFSHGLQLDIAHAQLCQRWKRCLRWTGRPIKASSHGRCHRSRPSSSYFPRSSATVSRCSPPSDIDI
jgi:hypothetical protein